MTRKTLDLEAGTRGPERPTCKSLINKEMLKHNLGPKDMEGWN